MSIRKKLAAVAIAAGVIVGSAISIVPTANAARCNDGTWSNSSGRGTCSWHGGVEGGSKSYGNSYGSNSYGNKYGSNSYGNKYGSGLSD